MADCIFSLVVVEVVTDFVEGNFVVVGEEAAQGGHGGFRFLGGCAEFDPVAGRDNEALRDRLQLEQFA